MCLMPDNLDMIEVPLPIFHHTPKGTLITLLCSPQYATTCFMYITVGKPPRILWRCDDVPGWFAQWAHLRDRLHTCYTRALSDW